MIMKPLKRLLLKNIPTKLLKILNTYNIHHDIEFFVLFQVKRYIISQPL